MEGKYRRTEKGVRWGPRCGILKESIKYMYKIIFNNLMANIFTYTKNKLINNRQKISTGHNVERKSSKVRAIKCGQLLTSCHQISV